MRDLYYRCLLLTQMKIRTDHIDAVLYAGIGVFTALQLGLSDESAYKYVNPYILFWLKWIIGGISAGFLGLKTYRSTAFAKHMDEVHSDENKDKPAKIKVNEASNKVVDKVLNKAEDKLNV